jgi:ABC-type transport system involved in cytochrome bd biosynthesis fused ATPase/permease subunit
MIGNKLKGLFEYKNKNVLSHADIIPSFQTLPLLSPLFFFQHSTGFRKLFIVLTFIRVISTALRFYTVYLISVIISNFSYISDKSLFLLYIPLCFIVLVVSEWLDYLTRRYAEQFPLRYYDYATLIMLKRLFALDPQRMHNFSKERTLVLIERYIQHVRAFLND